MEKESRRASSSSRCDLKLQTLAGQRKLATELPIQIWASQGRISLEAGETSIAEIDQRAEDGSFVLRSKVPALVDSATAAGEMQLHHGCKISFLGNYYAKDGSHVVIPLFSKVYLDEHGGDFIDSSKSVFFPKRKFAHAPRTPMESRIILHKWNYEERDHLKKFLLVFGYGRWDKIKEASREASVHFDTKLQMGLYSKSDSEIKAFANAFVRAICDNFYFERYELKTFMLNLIDEKPADPYVPVNSKDWDLNMIRQRANPWGKRFQLLFRVQAFIRSFDEYYLKKHGRRPELVFEYQSLLNFLSNNHLQGQRPSVWWTRSHDIDLLVGTYRYGYANYQNMKNCEEFGFADLEKSLYFHDFPNADTITRRLKKLIQLIVRHEKEAGTFDFESKEAIDPELAEFSKKEKLELFNFVVDLGIPVNAEGKPNWTEIREKFYAYSKYEPKSMALIEKLVNDLRMVCQQIIQRHNFSLKATPEQLAKFKGLQMDSDLDVSADQAEEFYHNTNVLKFIRKTILFNDQHVFKTGLEEFLEECASLPAEHPAYMGENYKPEIQDLGLLLYLSENGFGKLADIRAADSVYGFRNSDYSIGQLRSRVDFVCESFKQQLDKTSFKKKKTDKTLPGVPDLLKRKAKNQVQKDDVGNIIYPIIISSSLKLVSPGTEVKPGPNYHSEYNLFPVGYVSVRTYYSMFNKGEKAEYTCEILDGGDKPIYRVTSSEDPEHPIEGDSSTYCWVTICKKVNDISDKKKQKVTISGTERFGLLEDTVKRIIEFLPGADECTGYTFKFKNN